MVAADTVVSGGIARAGASMAVSMAPRRAQRRIGVEAWEDSDSGDAGAAADERSGCRALMVGHTSADPSAAGMAVSGSAWVVR